MRDAGTAAERESDVGKGQIARVTDGGGGLERVADENRASRRDRADDLHVEADTAVLFCASRGHEAQGQRRDGKQCERDAAEHVFS